MTTPAAEPLPHAGADAQATAARLAAIVESSDDAIVSKSLDGIITSWNPAAERLFGYSPAEAIGKSIRMIVPEDRQHEEDEVLRRIRAGERIEHFETVRLRKDGTLVDISLTVSPIREESGRITGASKIARDITDRKRAEAALQRSIEAQGQFLSLVSHELRTPIAIIVGNGHLLMRRNDVLLPEDRAQALLDLTSEAERLQRIIENLLLLTRAGANEEFDPEFVKLERIADEVIATFQRRSGRTVNLYAEGSLPPVLGEATITRLVLENLLSNADKYSPRGAEVDVKVGRRGEFVDVQVLDRGLGLSDADEQSIFDAFYRSPEARETASGMGLGLAVCRKVVEVQGGQIWGRRREGGGSEFGFALPVAPVPEE